MPINSFENYPMSWKPLIDKTGKPIYQLLAGQLVQDISNGVLLPGTKLPPQRELADYLDLNLSTISKAFKVCEIKGLISATVGSGTFVSYDALSNAYLLDDIKPSHLIEMGATLPDSASYEPLLLQLKNMLQSTHSSHTMPNLLKQLWMMMEWLWKSQKKLNNHPDTKFIYTIPDFQNPTGRTFKLERRKRMIELANQYDVLIVEDNPYGAVRFAGEELPPVKHFDTENRVIYISTFSKIFTPGLRLGWICR